MSRSRKSRGCAEAYRSTPHKQPRRLTPRLAKKTISGWKLADLVFVRIALGLLITAFVIPADVGAAPAQSRGAAGDEGILAIGTASLNEGNLSAARRQALTDALRKGVEADLLRRLDGKIVAGRISRFVEELVPAARNEIANYNILGEEEGESVYRVLVRLRTNEQTLETILEEKGFLEEEGPRIGVLFMVSRRTAGHEVPVYWWGDPESHRGLLLPVELSLQRAFEDIGFASVSRVSEVPEGEGSERLRSVDLDVEDAVLWGRLCSADVVIIGSCVQGDGMVSISLRALDVASGSVMAEQGAQSSLDPELEGPEQLHEGIQRAAKDVSGQLGQRIRDAFLRIETEPERLTLSLEGIGSFTQLQAFSRFVQGGVPGVESVTQTRFKGDTVTFSIGYREGPDRFLDSLLNQPEPPFPMTAHKNESGEIVVSPL